MPTINLSAKLKAFPYNAPAVTSAAQEAQEEASAIDDFISDLEESSSNIPTDISQIIGPNVSPGAGVAGTDEWNRMAIPIDSKLGWVTGITSGMESAFKALDKIATLLSKILKILELFNSSFNSFSKLFVSVINFAQNKIDEMSQSLTAGVYANVIAPPALLRKSAGDINSRNQLRGGFQGFISRFESSLHNTKDDNRPTFSINAYVGGLVIVVDTESIDRVWTGLQQLAAMFDFMKLFPINLSPPPPTNLRGYCGYFLDPAELEKPRAERDLNNKKFGVQIEWDNSFVSSAYNVYRSRFTGGEAVEVPYGPSTLTDDPETGEPGLLTVVADSFSAMKSGRPVITPMKTEYVYADPDFNDKKPVKVAAPLTFSPTLKYTDTDIKTEPVTGQEDITYAYIEEDGVHVPITNYYYMIRATGITTIKEGPNSQELNVAIKTCNDNYNIADVIAHPQGRFEFLAVGAGKLNNWSSIQISAMVPWYIEIIDMLSGFLASLGGTVTDASDAFSDFLDHMISRIRMYGDILSLITWTIEQFKTFIFGPSLALLNLPPVKGGMPVFVERVKQAEVPEGSQGFSGPNGITVGIVLVYGASGAQIGSIMALAQAFELIVSLLTEN
jgi:hypothetical protein